MHTGMHDSIAVGTVCRKIARLSCSCDYSQISVSAAGVRYKLCNSVSGLVVEYVVAIDVTRVRFPADAFLWTQFLWQCQLYM